MTDGMVTVEHMYALGWGEGDDTWKWWRRLLAWRSSLRSARFFFLTFNCRMTWKMSGSGI